MSYILQAGVCPFCGSVLEKTEMTDQAMVQIRLSDGSIMPQPVCLRDRFRLSSIGEVQKLFTAIQQRWISEIEESDRNPQEKIWEIKRINQLYPIEAVL